MTKRLTLTLLFSWLLIAAWAQEEDCKKKKDSDGIKVYACKTENAKFKSLKAEFTIHDTSIDQYVAFMKNVSNYPTWQYNMESAKILKQESDNVMTIRSLINAPWPVDDRELIVQYQFTRVSPDEVHVSAKTVATEYPKSDDYVRVPFSNLQWVVKKSGTGLTAIYHMHIDPGGTVPAWLVNMAIAEGPYHSFMNLKKQLEKKQ